MANKAIAKNYEQFSPAERLTLLLEAMARKDEMEVNQLSGSCPHRIYTCPDMDFEDRRSRAFGIMAVVCIDLRCMWGKLHALEWATEAIRQTATQHQINTQLACLEGVRCGQGLPQMEFFARASEPIDRQDNGVPDGEDAEHLDQGDGDEELEQPADHLRRFEAVEMKAENATACQLRFLARVSDGIAEEFITVWDAFDRFCRTRLGVEPQALLEAWEFPVTGDFTASLKRYAHLKADSVKAEEYFQLICINWDGKFGSP